MDDRLGLGLVEVDALGVDHDDRAHAGDRVAHLAQLVDLLGILGLSDHVRNGYGQITVAFQVEGDADEQHTTPDTVETGQSTGWWLAGLGAAAAGVLVAARRRLGLTG